MRTAIVNITCPWCGGRVEGIQSTEQPQRHPCPYCRTELHVPRVGDRIIHQHDVVERQIVREVVVHEGYEMRQKPNWLAAAIMIPLVFVLLMLLLATRSRSVTTHPSAYDLKRQQEKTCETECERHCPVAPPRITTLDHYEVEDINHVVQGADNAMCSARCTLTCYDTVLAPGVLDPPKY